MLIAPKTLAVRPRPRVIIMKKLRTTAKVRKNVAKKRLKRKLRSKAKQAHRRGTGYKDLEDED